MRRGIMRGAQGVLAGLASLEEQGSIPRPVAGDHRGRRVPVEEVSVEEVRRAVPARGFYTSAQAAAEASERGE